MLRITRRIALLLCLGALPGAAQSTGKRWVSAWANGVQTFLKGEGGSYTAFHDQTVRMFVHPTIGGEAVRIRLTAAGSYSSILLDAASVAVRGQENSMKPGTLKPLTFHGEKSVLIPGGSTVWSDPIAMPVEAFHDLVVSIHIPEFDANETGHLRSMATSFILGGDQTSAETMPASPLPKKVESTYFLQGIDVLSDEHAYAIVAFGDSITDGFKSTWGENHRWPDYFATRLAAAQPSITTGKFAVLNAGISGNRLLHEFNGPNALSRLNRDVLEQAGVRLVILTEGINDINMNANNPKGIASQIATTAQMFEAYRQIADRVHSWGMRFVLCTLTPTKGFSGYDEQTERDRKTVNQWIRTSKFADGVIDFDAALRDPADPARLLPAYDSGDHIHPSDAGYEVMAKTIDIRSLVSSFFPKELAPAKK